jgi:hypothetical protein
MNAVETAAMNNPVRRAVQRHYAVRLLRRLGGRMAGGRALEIGCGQGYGIVLILDQFGATIRLTRQDLTAGKSTAGKSTFQATNQGKFPHDLVIEGPRLDQTKTEIL